MPISLAETAFSLRSREPMRYSRMHCSASRTNASRRSESSTYWASIATSCSTSARVGMFLVIARIRRHRREARGLFRRQCGRARAEVTPRRGFGAENPIAPFDDVEIELEDAALVEHRLEHQGDQRFFRLAPIASLRRKKQILRELLRDRRAAGDHTAATHVLVDRLLDSVPVEAFVLYELRVLC